MAAMLLVGMVGLSIANSTTYSKAYSMYLFLTLVWACLAVRRYRRWLPPLGLALVVAYFGVIAPVLMAARSGPLAAQETTTDRLLTTLERWMGERTQLGDGNFYVDQLDALLLRQLEPAPVAFLISEVQTYGLRGGETMEYAKYAFIPRAL